MNLSCAICIFIFVSSDYVVSRSIKDNNIGQVFGGELNQEESQLKIKPGDDNQLSELEATASERDDNASARNTNASGEEASATAGDTNSSTGDTNAPPGDTNKPAGDTNVSAGDFNPSINEKSQVEQTEEYKSYEDSDEAQSGKVTGPGKKLVVYQWRNGIVPYFVDAHSYDIVIYLRIRKALDAIESASCLVFKPIPKPTSGHSFVHFTNPNKERECVHKLSVGQRGEPVMVLGYDCMQERDIIHSVMHLLGFRDEVTHPHRDSYIRILWNNIQPKYRPLFTIDTKTLWTHKLTEYDTLSVMHFHDRAFSVNGGPTILPLLSDRIINPSDELSLLDKMKLRIAFGNECNRRQVDYLVETCKNYARDDKKAKDNTAEDRCAFDKFKVTTELPDDKNENTTQNERLCGGIIGMGIGALVNMGLGVINNLNTNIMNNGYNANNFGGINVGTVINNNNNNNHNCFNSNCNSNHCAAGCSQCAPCRSILR